MAFKDYSPNPSANTTLGADVYIGPNMSRNKVRPALQQLAADGRTLADQVANIPAGKPGINGGVQSGDGGGTLFTGCAGMEIKEGVTGFDTVGYSVPGLGAGRYVFDSAVNAAFVTANPRWSFLAADGRGFRLANDGMSTHARQFGAVMLGKPIDDTDALTAAIDYARRYGQVDPTAPSVVGALTIEFGRGRPYTTTPINLKATTRFVGASSGLELGGAATIFEHSDTAFIVNRANTFDMLETSLTTGADGSSFEGIFFRYVGPGKPETGGYGQASAIRGCARVRLTSCQITECPGVGLDIVATSGQGSTTQGEASGCPIRDCSFSGNFVNVRIGGGDSNVQMFDTCTFGQASRWGFEAAAFLSSTMINCHFKNNGIADAAGRSLTIYQGKFWQTVPGGDALWSTTPPGTNSAVWGYVPSDSEPINPNAENPAWVNGGKYKLGGPVYHAVPTARTVFIGCYRETGQGFPIIMFPGMSFGGEWSHSTFSTGQHIAGDLGSINAGNFTAKVFGNEVQASLGLGEVALYAASFPIGIKLQVAGKDVRIAYGNSDTTASMIITGPATDRTMGRAVTTPNVAYFFKGFAFGNRMWEPGTVPPTSGADGEIIYNTNPSIGGPARWHRAQGTTQPEGIVGAVQATLSDTATLADVIAALKAAKLAKSPA